MEENGNNVDEAIDLVNTKINKDINLFKEEIENELSYL